MVSATNPSETDTLNSDGVDVPAATPRMLSWARNSTIYRLQRRMMTEKELRDAIRKKARQKFEEISDAQVKAVGDYAVSFAYEQKALNDTAYAEIKTSSAVRAGKSKRAISVRLSAKGIEKSVLQQALENADDLSAAVIFARKRAFGPFRKCDLDEKRKAKELSAFARNGFAFSIGQKVMAMDEDEAVSVLGSK